MKCSRCTASTQGFKLCSECRENRREYAAAHRAAGYCVDCNRVALSSRCSTCAAKRRK